MELPSFESYVKEGGSPELDRVWSGCVIDPASYVLDPSIDETDFRHIARKRLSTQDKAFQEKWLRRINDTDSYGRVMGYTALWTAMVVHENWKETS